MPAPEKNSSYSVNFLENLPSKPKNPELKVRSRVARSILVVFLLLFGFSVALYLKLQTEEVMVKETKVDYLAVVSVSPFGEVSSPKPKIVVNFNLPVTAHHVGEYFSVSPDVKGELKQGNGPEEIVFEVQENLPRGARVSVNLKSGFPSDSGKKLLDDYSFHFSIKNDPSNITFMKGEWAGKFMSFQASRGTDITLKVGPNVDKSKIVVYKADVQTMLQSFVYQKVDNGYNYFTDKYIERVVDSSRLTKFEEYSDVKDNQNINFKGPIGLYLFQAIEGESIINTVWVTLNETGIHLRQDDKKIFLAAQSLENGNPVSGVNVNFYKQEETPKTLALHTLSGIQEYPFPYPGRLDLVVGRKGDDVMVVPVSIPNSQAEIKLYESLDSKYQIFLYTDRPIYKAGDKLSFRGIVRKDNDALYQGPDIKKLRTLVSYGQDKSLDLETEVKQGGFFYGEFMLPKEMSEQDYALRVTTELDKSKDVFTRGASIGSAIFSVFEYKKPTYGIDVELEKSDYLRSQLIKAKVSGKYFDGQPLKNERVKVSVYSRDYYETEKTVYNSSFKLNGWGGMCGGGGFDDEYYGQQIGTTKEFELNDSGEVVVEFSSSDLKSILSQEVTIIAEKVDESSNKIVAGKNAIVHQGEFNVFFRPGPGRFTFTEDFKTLFYAEKLNGEKVANEDFTYEIYKEKWDGGNSAREIVKTGFVKTDSNGVGIITEKIDANTEESYFRISVKGIDGLNNTIDANKSIFLVKKDSKNSYKDWFSSISQTTLKIVSHQNSYRVGEMAKLEIEAPENLVVFAAFERGRAYTPQWINLKKGQNIFEFEVLPEYAPSITPTFSFFYNGEYFIEGLSLNVPAMHKLIDVEVSADKEKYNPGDTAIFTIKTIDSLGNLISADVGVGIVDKAIYALRKNAAPPLHSSFYYFRGRSVNSSSSLTWIATYDWGGGGGGGGGFESFLKDSDTLYWNPLLKTGSDGEVKIEIPVGSTETTWRIMVYASDEDTKLGQGQKDFLVTSK